MKNLLKKFVGSVEKQVNTRGIKVEEGAWKGKVLDATILFISIKVVHYFTYDAIGFWGVFLMYLVGFYGFTLFRKPKLFFKKRHIKWDFFKVNFKTLIYIAVFFTPTLTGKFLLSLKVLLVLILGERYLFYRDENRRPKDLFEHLDAFFFIIEIAFFIRDKILNKKRNKKS